SFVPRVALTKVLGRFHAKFLFSQAFRAPGIENININPAIKPEDTTVFEGEAGVQLNDHMFLAVNAYDITIDKPIVYDVDPMSGAEVYQNFDQTGTRGLEADYRIRYPWGYANVNYSFYTTAGKNRVTSYQVPGQNDVLLALPAHKLTMSGSFKLLRSL